MFFRLKTYGNLIEFEQYMNDLTIVIRLNFTIKSIEWHA